MSIVKDYMEIENGKDYRELQERAKTREERWNDILILACRDAKRYNKPYFIYAYYNPSLKGEAYKRTSFVLDKEYLVGQRMVCICFSNGMYQER